MQLVVQCAMTLQSNLIKKGHFQGPKGAEIQQIFILPFSMFEICVTLLVYYCHVNA